MLKYDRNRALSARWIYISVFATPLFLMLTRMDTIAGILRAQEPPAAGWTKQFILDTLQGDAMLFFLPVICALPYASSFVDEAKSGVTKFVLTRVKCSRYLSSKAAAAAFSGGTVVLLGTLVFLCAALVLFLPLEEGSRGQELAAAVLHYCEAAEYTISEVDALELTISMARVNNTRKSQRETRFAVNAE